MVARKAFVGVSNVLYQKEKKRRKRKNTLGPIYDAKKHVSICTRCTKCVENEFLFRSFHIEFQRSPESK